jgi:hypothetical protein
MGELVTMRSDVTDNIRELWSQHAKLKRERAKIDDAIEKLLQGDKPRELTEAEELAS